MNENLRNHLIELQDEVQEKITAHERVDDLLTHALDEGMTAEEYDEMIDENMDVFVEMEW